MRKETTLGNTHPRAVMAAVIRAVRRRGGVQFHADAAAARLKIMQRAVAAGDPGDEYTERALSYLGDVVRKTVLLDKDVRKIGNV